MNQCVRRWPRVIARCLGFVVGTLLSVAPVASASAGATAAEKPPVVADVADSYRVVLDDQPVTLVLALTVSENVTLGTVTTSVVGVDSQKAAELGALFSAELDKDGLITVTVGSTTEDMVAFPPPATYQLRLDIAWTSTGTTSATSPTKVIVKIEVPTAVITATPKLEVHQRVTCLFDFDRLCVGDPHTETEALTVHETSGSASTGDLTVTTGDIAQPAGGSPVSISSTGGKVGPGGTATFPYEVSGDIDSGTATATLTIDGERVAATAVEVTVERRQSGWTYVILLIVGLLIGLGVRKILVDRIARGDALTDYGRRRAEIVKARLASRDTALSLALDGVLTELDQSVKTAKPSEIKDKVATATSTVTTKQNEYKTRLAGVQTERTAFVDEVAKLNYEPLRTEFDAAMLGVKLVDSSILEGNAAKAQTDLDALLMKSKAALIGAGEKWAAALGAVIDSVLAKQQASMPEEAFTASPNLATRAAELGGMTNLTWTDLPGSVRTAVVAVSELRLFFASVVEIGRQVSDLTPARLIDQDLVPAVDDLARQLDRGGEPNSSSPGAAQRVGFAADRSIAAWIADIGGSSDAQSARAARNYVNAARLLQGQKREDPAADDPGIRLLGGEAVPPTLTFDATVPAAAAPASVSAPPMLPRELSVSKAGLTVLKVVLWTVGFAAIVSAAAIVLPATIVGTAIQQIGVLVWSITLPPTYEGFISQVGKIAPAPG